MRVESFVKFSGVALAAFVSVVACARDRAASAGDLMVAPASLDGGSTLPSTTCGACLATACNRPAEICASDPSCALHLDCIGSCMRGPDGAIDPACESSCPPVSAGTAQRALDAFQLCRAEARCLACGGDDAGGFGIPQVCPSESDAGDPCNACVDHKCCGFRADCRAESDCGSMTDCMHACTGTSATLTGCANTCAQQHPTGAPIYLREFGCVSTVCIQECGNGASCSTCIAERCPQQDFACYGDLACMSALDCINACKLDATCLRACNDRYSADALAAANALLVCSLNRCSDVCASP